MKAPETTLTFQSQYEILRGVFSLFGNVQKYSDEMYRLGFRSFLAWQNFHNSICSIDGLGAWSRYQTENARLSIESPDGIGLDRQVSDYYIWSNVISRFSDNNIGLSELRKKTLSEYYYFREQEIRHFLDKDPKDDIRDKYSILRQCLIEDMMPLGFEFDRARSSAKLPVISKQASSHWDICFSAISPQGLRSYPAIPGRFPRRWSTDFRFYLRPRKSRGLPTEQICFEHSDTIWIRLSALVDGFGGAYRGVDDPKEFKIITKAHAALYGNVRSVLEPHLSEKLQ